MTSPTDRTGFGCDVVIGAVRLPWVFPPHTQLHVATGFVDAWQRAEHTRFRAGPGFFAGARRAGALFPRADGFSTFRAGGPVPVAGSELASASADNAVTANDTTINSISSIP